MMKAGLSLTYMHLAHQMEKEAS